ncbi:MAG: hypothetical protein LBM04_11950 [Opitutaceae bacterium]|nr:hypothetical protein [Opitutaceae bacterium]
MFAAGHAPAFAAEVTETAVTAVVTNCKIHRDTKLGITLVTGKVTLPGDAIYWRPPRDAGSLSQIECIIDDEPDWEKFHQGKRQAAARHETGGHGANAQPPASTVVSSRTFEFTAMLDASGGAGRATSVDFEVTEPESDTIAKIRWDWTNAANGDAGTIQKWATDRAHMWMSQLLQLPQPSGESLLRSMVAASGRVFNFDPDLLFPDDDDRFGERAGMPSLLALTGGRAAVDETLQLRELAGERRSGNKAGGEDKTVPLSSLKGVGVKSHPFEKMLADALAQNPPAKKSGAASSSVLTPALADCVPVDRAFFHVMKPAAIRSLLLDGSPSMRRIAALANSDMNMGIFERYSASLGLTPQLAKMLWEQGLAEEYAVFTPDLFFADGTDVTLIARTPSAHSFDLLLKPLLALLGSAPDKDGIVPLPSAAPDANGARAWWASRGDLVFMSTNAAELRHALALCDAKGAGSLGRSAEFRYMLFKLPDTASTEGRVYLSDPFLRRLTGPGTKIGQFRRTEARLRMEAIVAGALLRRLDAPAARESLETLARLGYVEKDAANNGADSNDITFAPGTLAVRSAAFGPLARMHPLSAQAGALQNVTETEAAAYTRYMERYSDFWREFFDPIALRLDAGAKPGAHALETFILPLLDNTIYNTLRELFVTGGGTVKTPAFEREPVAMFSARLPEEMWVKIAGSFESSEQRLFAISGKFFDLLGPSAHLALVDAAPVVRTGAGGAADMFAISRQFGGRDVMLAVPAVALAFTRPCQLVVELDDPKAAIKYLESAAAYDRERDRDWVRVDWAKRAGNEWILSLTIAGMFSMDYSVRVENGFLVVSNFPWDPPLRVTGSRAGALNSVSIDYWPRAMQLSLPSDFATAMKTERAQAIAGMANLYPWMYVLGLDKDAASAAALRTLGAAPVLPKGALTWVDNQALDHERLGSAWDAKLPEYDRAGGDFGTFDSVTRASASMQFEDDGLRTRVTWETAR